jgi:hypothetical protein
LEELQLSAELATALPLDPATAEVETTLEALSAGVSAAAGVLKAAVERCVRVTGGTELLALLSSVDRQGQQFLTRLQAAAGILQGRCVGV